MDIVLWHIFYSIDYDLKEPLEELKAKSLFEDSVDFSAINGEKNLRISSAVHKAFIEINEEGAESSSATGVHLVYLNAPFPLKIDRPFLFMIRDNSNGLILFMGKVMTLLNDQLLSFGFI